MIPPLFLDVKPHHNVSNHIETYQPRTDALSVWTCVPHRDPRSVPFFGALDITKGQTSQIIEALNPHDAESTGLLIANDSDYKRTHMLVHQTGRMPSKGLIITNLDAGKLSAARRPFANYQLSFPT